jgi:hypothetical protein
MGWLGLVDRARRDHRRRDRVERLFALVARTWRGHGAPQEGGDDDDDDPVPLNVRSWQVA